MGRKKQENRRMCKEQMGFVFSQLEFKHKLFSGAFFPTLTHDSNMCDTPPMDLTRLISNSPCTTCNSTPKYKKMQVNKRHVMLELYALNCVRSKSFQNSDALTIICNKLLAVNNNTLYPNTSLRIAWYWY